MEHAIKRVQLLDLVQDGGNARTSFALGQGLFSVHELATGMRPAMTMLQSIALRHLVITGVSVGHDGPAVTPQQIGGHRATMAVMVQRHNRFSMVGIRRIGWRQASPDPHIGLAARVFGRFFVDLKSGFIDQDHRGGLHRNLEPLDQGVDFLSGLDVPTRQRIAWDVYLMTGQDGGLTMQRQTVLELADQEGIGEQARSDIAFREDRRGHLGNLHAMLFAATAGILMANMLFDNQSGRDVFQPFAGLGTNARFAFAAATDLVGVWKVMLDDLARQVIGDRLAARLGFLARIGDRFAVTFVTGRLFDRSVFGFGQLLSLIEQIGHQIIGLALGASPIPLGDHQAYLLLEGLQLTLRFRLALFGVGFSLFSIGFASSQRLNVLNELLVREVL